ncbi:metallophosphoesterase [Algicella marina]|uniref:Metallophosphoesterase n=1 Tax=Algicella marina TaxID=2683284 RepID=A0A6P1T149_9RHOB|nr:metallophosphoesterase [Algicella marina]QHQ35717.1 metallophosphoesterase [Algicella marina]
MSARVVTHSVSPQVWPEGLALRIVMIADLHACWPWMSLARVERIVAQAQALEGDMITLMGDYPGHIRAGRRIPPRSVAQALAGLSAPLGVWAVFGNHDWRADGAAQEQGKGETFWHRTFEEEGIAALNNSWRILEKDGAIFGLAGIDSQRAYRAVKTIARDGAHDLDAALTGIGEVPTVLLAHEPDIFAEMREPVVLQLSGHTHGGQIRPFGKPYVVPSKFGTRYAYGHIRENGRHLVVSGGLGCTTLPLRWGMPPEITVVEVS